MANITIKENPWGDVIKDLPNTILAFMQLQYQLEKDKVNLAYQENRDELKFQQELYLNNKKREDTWLDKLSVAGYSTEHITTGGSELLGSTTNDYINASAESEQIVSDLQQLNSELLQMKEKGKQFEEQFGAFESAASDKAWQDLMLQGDIKTYQEGDVIPEGKAIGDIYGTSEIAQALSALDSSEIDKLKDENFIRAFKSGLKTESEAVKLYQTGVSASVAAAKIGQDKYISDISNALSTAKTYSGMAAIQAIGALGDGATAKQLSTAEASKLELGKDYLYLVMGQKMTPIEEASESELKMYQDTYSKMVLDFQVATPTYAKGGYGSTVGTAKSYNENLANVYLNWENMLQTDPGEARAFATRALELFGVDITDEAAINNLRLGKFIEEARVMRAGFEQMGGDADELPAIFNGLNNISTVINNPNDQDIINTLNEIENIHLADWGEAKMKGSELFPGLLEGNRALSFQLEWTPEELEKLGAIDKEAHEKNLLKSLIGADINLDAELFGDESRITDAWRDKKTGKIALEVDPDRGGNVFNAFGLLSHQRRKKHKGKQIFLEDYEITGIAATPEGMPMAVESDGLPYYFDPRTMTYRIKRNFTEDELNQLIPPTDTESDYDDSIFSGR